MKKTKLSVIVPIHNGGKYIKHTVKMIQKQDYCNYELILVENGSNDNSWEILQQIRKQNPNIIIFKNKKRGTSLARRKGIELATGEYITFSDQDDQYLNKTSFTRMVDSIEKDDSDICQFGYYSRICGIRRLHSATSETRIITRERLMQKEIEGIVSSGTYALNTNVWSKIYRTSILKEIVNKINQPLYYCEDMYLNTIAFFNKNIKKISIRPEAYYIWNVGIGTSGSEKAARRLFYEYEFLKPLTIDLAKKNSVNEEIIYKIYMEIIYFMKTIINNMLDERISDIEIINEIEKYEKMNIVKLAKQYLKMNAKLYNELNFLTSSYTASEYYDYLVIHRNVNKKKLMVKKIIRFIRKFTTT